MCTGSGPSEIVVPSITRRDTSNEMVKSDYALSEENKKKNAEIAARNKAKSLISFGREESESTGAGVTYSSGKISEANRLSQPSGGYSDASGGFLT